MTFLDTAGRSVLLFGQATRRWAETTDLDVLLHDIVYSCCQIVPCSSAAVAVTSAVPNGYPVQVRAASDPAEFDVLLDIVGQVSGSPGVLAAATRSTILCPDLTTEARPELRQFAALTVARTDIRATAAFALRLHERLVGVLNVYFSDARELDRSATDRAATLADSAAVVVTALAAEQRADRLEVALETSHTIGAAIGVLVERHRISREAAFARLRTTSRRLNRTIAAVAEHLVATGSIDGDEGPPRS